MTRRGFMIRAGLVALALTTGLARVRLEPDAVRIGHIWSIYDLALPGDGVTTWVEAHKIGGEIEVLDVAAGPSPVDKDDVEGIEQALERGCDIPDGCRGIFGVRRYEAWRYL